MCVDRVHLKLENFCFDCWFIHVSSMCDYEMAILHNSLPRSYGHTAGVMPSVQWPGDASVPKKHVSTSVPCVRDQFLTATSMVSSGPQVHLFWIPGLFNDTVSPNVASPPHSYSRTHTSKCVPKKPLSDWVFLGFLQSLQGNSKNKPRHVSAHTVVHNVAIECVFIQNGGAELSYFDSLLGLQCTQPQCLSQQTSYVTVWPACRSWCRHFHDTECSDQAHTVMTVLGWGCEWHFHSRWYNEVVVLPCSVVRAPVLTTGCISEAHPAPYTSKLSVLNQYRSV
jgi:hypothetical protein